jgi:hypothetical protein
MALTEWLRLVTAEVDALDLQLNAHRVARYEALTALNTLGDYLRSRRARDLADVGVRLGRAAEMVPLDRRASMRAAADEIVKLVASLSPEESARLADDPVLTSPEASSPKTVRPLTALVDPSRQLEFMINVMRRLPHGLEHWTWERSGPTRDNEGSFWPIESERHVQSLLWVALAPALSDLTWEPQLPAAGIVQPRPDFGLASLRMAIEVKIIRVARDFRTVTEGIAADASLYLTAQTPFERMVAFVWDQTRSVERHQTLVRGLKDLGGVVDAVVVPRPALMAR